MWTIWSERIVEAPRRGITDDQFRDTLDHLRRRGDKRVRFQREDIDPITILDLQTVPTEPGPGPFDRVSRSVTHPGPETA